MCTCASCSYTDKFARKSFAEWPRGEPKGERASNREYAEHWRHCNAMRDYVPLERSWPQRMPILPGLVHPVQRNATAIAWNAGRKAAPESAARPSEPGKARPHFPEPDRNGPKATASIRAIHRLEYGANDSEVAVAKFMTVTQAAERWDISPMRIRQWLADGRIKGAEKIGRDWLIPDKAQRPKPEKPGAFARQSSG